MEMDMREDLILGLDLGTNSLGWALLKCDTESKTEIKGIVDAGVRIFEAGMKGDIASGKAESRCASRREARSIRRGLDRRRRRMGKLKNLLQRNDLLPEGEDIASIIESLDKDVREFIRTIPDSEKPEKHILAHTAPYFLRTLAIQQELPKHMLGRAIYHLAQRRGFLSNRKSQVEEKELGQVKEGIADLTAEMAQAGARTLGEYFAYTDPTEKRIRQRWTSRKMYETEFNLIMKRNGHQIPEDQIELIRKAIFFQRKLKSQKSLIGKCTLEKNKRRCSKYRREAQEFRYLQTVNNLRLITHDGELRVLTDEERDELINMLSGESGMLNKHGNLTVPKAKIALGLNRKSKFTIEEGGEKSFKGDRTTSAIVEIIGSKWLDMNHETQEKLIHDLNSFEKTENLQRRLAAAYGISEENAARLSQVNLESDYASLSLTAIQKLLPHMRKGLSYSEAVAEEYPEQFKTTGIEEELLPQLIHFSEDLRNPVVQRCLTELRKVVNAVIREYGKPGLIRLELAREIKNTKKAKERIIKNNREREKERKQALKEIHEVFPGFKESRDDITKILLAKECGWVCPYTGEGINFDTLFENPKFDIEHIIPRSRSMDNSFVNKTLCFHDENRNVKRNRTPYETYHGTAKYDQILNRVSAFKGNLAKKKLELFMMTPEEVTDRYEDFSNRQLNDTRYASKEAAAYLGLLYGGVNQSADGTKRVQVLSGGLTALVRSFHGFNGILNDGGSKDRKDHRHHAVDAIAIGITSPGMVKRLSDNIRIQEQYGSAESIHTSRFNSMECWPGMLEECRAKIKDIIASHHVSRKIRGALHKKTFYSIDHEHEENGNIKKYKHVPVELASMETSAIPKIVDDGIRRIVENKLEELGETEPKKAFREERNLPELISKDGQTRIPVRKVKIRRSQDTVTVGKGPRKRNVVSGSNHHMLIYAELDKNGKEKKWAGEVVSLLEASRRLKNNEPVIQRDVGPGRKFIMSIQCGDIFELATSAGRLFVIVRAVPKTKQLCFAEINDARKKEVIKKNHMWYTKYPNTLRTSNPVKYTIDPLGRLRRAND